MDTATTPLWIGTYPEAGAGTPAGVGEGIWRVDLDPPTGALTGARLAVRRRRRAFLAAHPGGRVVYAVAEDATARVTAFAVTDDGGLDPLATVGSGGAYPCHLLLAPDARTLYVANYVTGTVGVLPLDADGALAPDVLAAGGPVQVLGDVGAGPRTDRQEGPHAHFAAFAPGGDRLLVCDLGTDRLRRYRVAADGLLTRTASPRGCRPAPARATSPSGPPGRPADHLYLAGELDDTVRVLRWDAAASTATVVADRCRPRARRSPTPVRARPPPAVRCRRTSCSTATGSSSRSAGPTSSSPGRSTRATGLLGAPVETDAGGAWPRHLEVVDGLAVVAEQGSGRARGRPAAGRRGRRPTVPLRRARPAWSPSCADPRRPAAGRALSGAAGRGAAGARVAGPGTGRRQWRSSPARRTPRSTVSIEQPRVAMLSVHTSPLDQPGVGDAGGMNVYVTDLSRALARRGAQVEIFTRATRSDQPDVVELDPGDPRVLVRHVPGRAVRGARQERPARASCARSPRASCRPRRAGPGAAYDVVHSHYWLSGPGGLARVRPVGRPARPHHAHPREGEERDPRAR